MPMTTKIYHVLDLIGCYLCNRFRYALYLMLLLQNAENQNITALGIGKQLKSSIVSSPVTSNWPAAIGNMFVLSSASSS